MCGSSWLAQDPGPPMPAARAASTNWRVAQGDHPPVHDPAIRGPLDGQRSRRSRGPTLGSTTAASAIASSRTGNEQRQVRQAHQAALSTRDRDPTPRVNGIRSLAVGQNPAAAPSSDAR